MLRLLSIIAVYYISPAVGVEVVMSAKTAVIRKESKQATTKKPPTCGQIQDAFQKEGTGHHTRTTFCADVNAHQLTSHAKCCQPDPESLCCANANHCHMSEIYQALDMGSCGASLVEREGEGEGGQGQANDEIEGEATEGDDDDEPVPKSTAAECNKVRKKFKKEGHHHTQVTFCVDAADYQPQCCRDPDGPPIGCCKKQDHCVMKDIYKSLGMKGCEP